MKTGILAAIGRRAGQVTVGTICAWSLLANLVLLMSLAAFALLPVPTAEQCAQVPPSTTMTAPTAQ